MLEPLQTRWRLQRCCCRSRPLPTCARSMSCCAGSASAAAHALWPARSATTDAKQHHIILWSNSDASQNRPGGICQGCQFQLLTDSTLNVQVEGRKKDYDERKGEAYCWGAPHVQAIDALREIFIAALLPDRKLKFFEEQPILAVPSNKEGLRCLLYCYVEDQIKKRSALHFTITCPS